MGAINVSRFLCWFNSCCPSQSFTAKSSRTLSRISTLLHVPVKQLKYNIHHRYTLWRPVFFCSFSIEICFRYNFLGLIRVITYWSLISKTEELQCHVLLRGEEQCGLLPPGLRVRLLLALVRAPPDCSCFFSQMFLFLPVQISVTKRQ